ncbi:MAG TPA: hypothetical protein VMH05_10590 [Bryobacteraceae bacterium]|nr:hypothetical protein [Bryobacteraceae bacterium]
MKRSIVARTFIMAALTALALGIAPTAKAQDKGCSNYTLRGTYSQIGTGVITAPPDMAGPFVNVGTLVFDGNGGVTGGLVVSVNGSSAKVTETGTYSVNSDCTGTYTVQIAPFGITSNASFVIDSNGDELEIIVTDPNSAITCVAKRLYPGRAI